mmetsp:Transcript_49499/g.158381  ORF Transcript_49499/g.158381 Transcript_49499/m.158381 type:complete len:363 (+) Transcript_49499:220-1308(+)
MSASCTSSSWTLPRWTDTAPTSSAISRASARPTATSACWMAGCGSGSTRIGGVARPRTKGRRWGACHRSPGSPPLTTSCSPAWSCAGRHFCCVPAIASSSSSSTRCSGGSAGSWRSRGSPCPRRAKTRRRPPRCGACSASRARPRRPALATGPSPARRTAAPRPPRARPPWPSPCWRSMAASSSRTASCPAKCGRSWRPSWPPSSEPPRSPRTIRARSSRPSYSTVRGIPAALTVAPAWGTSSCSCGPWRAPPCGSSGVRRWSPSRSTDTSPWPGAARRRSWSCRRRARATAAPWSCGPWAPWSTRASARTSSLTARPTAWGRVEAAARRRPLGHRARSCTSWARCFASTRPPRCPTTGPRT